MSVVSSAWPSNRRSYRSSALVAVGARSSLLSALLFVLLLPVGASAQCGVGDIVVADGALNYGLVRIPPAASTVQEFIPGFRIALDITSIGNNLFVVDNDEGQLYQVDCHTGAKATLASFLNPTGVSADPYSGIIYVLHQNSTVSSYELSSGVTSTILTGLEAYGIAVDAEGCVVVSENLPPRVSRFPTPGRCTATARTTLVDSSLLINAGSIAIHRATGDLYVADAGLVAPRIIKKPFGGAPFVLAAGGSISALYGLAVNQDTGALYATDPNINGGIEGGVLEVNTVSGNVTALNQGGYFSAPAGLTVLGPECGNGLVEAGEQCDDGNNDIGDCCGSTCFFEPAEYACDDGQFCNGAEMCDGAGFCIDAGDPIVCDDSNPCTVDECNEQYFECFHIVVDDGTTCDDGNACTTGEKCEFGDCVPADAVECPITDPCSWTHCDAAVGCVSTPGPAPASAVVGGASSSLIFNDKTNDSLDQIKWTITKAGAVSFPALGNPTVPFGASYGVCLWQDAVPAGPGTRSGTPFYSSLVQAAEADCGSSGDKACWAAGPKANPVQYAYTDAGKSVGGDAGENGIKKLLVKSGAAEKGKVQFQAQGMNVPEIAPVDGSTQFKLPVLAQVCNSLGTCWQSVFETSATTPAPKKNVPGAFSMTVK